MIKLQTSSFIGSVPTNSVVCSQIWTLCVLIFPLKWNVGFHYYQESFDHEVYMHNAGIKHAILSYAGKSPLHFTIYMDNFSCPILFSSFQTYYAIKECYCHLRRSKLNFVQNGCWTVTRGSHLGNCKTHKVSVQESLLSLLEALKKEINLWYNAHNWNCSLCILKHCTHCVFSTHCTLFKRYYKKLKPKYSVFVHPV